MNRRTFGAALAVAGSLAAWPLVAPVVADALVGPAVAQTRKASSYGRGTRVGAARNRFVYRGRGRAGVETKTAPQDPKPTGKPATAAGSAPAPGAPGSMPPGRRDYSALTTASLAPAEALKEDMRPALEAKARTLATGSLGSSRPEPLPILLQPRSVTFDLERGTRTVVYGDDIVVSEPYDAGRMRDLARPAAGAK